VRRGKIKKVKENEKYIGEKIDMKENEGEW
jgi:hypothetical protein